MTFQREVTSIDAPPKNPSRSWPLFGNGTTTGPVDVSVLASSPPWRVRIVAPCGASTVTVRVPPGVAWQTSATCPSPGTSTSARSWPAAASSPRHTTWADRASGLTSPGAPDSVRSVASTWQLALRGSLRSHCQVTWIQVGGASPAANGSSRTPRSVMSPSYSPVLCLSGDHLLRPSWKSGPPNCVWIDSRIAFSLPSRQSL